MSQSFVKALRAGEEVITGWSAIPNPLVSEALLAAGYDTVTLDMQHGFHDVASILATVTSCKMYGKHALVRIPVGDWGLASRALDMGAAAVIAPMINTVEDAKAFAASMKYPPIGGRSWGPARAMLMSDTSDMNSYLANANNETLAIAMIETREALDNLDAILAVPGIDGIFVGPSDVSVTFSDGDEIKPFSDGTIDVIEEIAVRTLAAGKIPCIFAFLPDMLKRSRAMGYRLFALSTDGGVIAKGATALLAEAKS